MRRHVFSILTLALGLLLVSGHAWADKPVKDDFMFTEAADYRYLSCDDQLQQGDLFFGHSPQVCDNGILFCEMSNMHIASTSFFDKDGNLLRYREKGKFDGFFYEYQNFDNRLSYGPINGGQFLIDYGDVDDPTDDTYSYTGLGFKISVPGYGVIVNAGRLIFAADWATPIKIAGQFPLWQGEIGPICEYLADYY